MKLKLDENLPRRARDLLCEHGYEAQTILDQANAGVEDAVLAELVQREGRTLITLDLGFADIRTYRPEQYAGIVVLRPPRADIDQVLALINGFLRLTETEPVEGRRGSWNPVAFASAAPPMGHRALLNGCLGGPLPPPALP